MTKFYDYIQEDNTLNEANILKFIKDFKNKKEQQIIKSLKSSWNKLLNAIKREGKEEEALKIINKALGTNYRSLDKLSKVNEKEYAGADPHKGGFINWLKSMIFQGTITASIFSGLQIFFELDTLIDMSVPDFKRLAIYAFLFLLFSTKTYMDWKKESD